jgi:hypothetical protein
MEPKQFHDLTIPELLGKLDELYEKEEKLAAEIQKLMIQYNQIKDDISLMQNFIMHKSNKTNRKRQWHSYTKS